MPLFPRLRQSSRHSSSVSGLLASGGLPSFIEPTGLMDAPAQRQAGRPLPPRPVVLVRALPQPPVAPLQARPRPRLALVQRALELGMQARHGVRRVNGSVLGLD